MTAAGILVPWRERLLDRLSGVRPDDVLNAGPASPQRREALQVAAGLKRAVNGLLTAAGVSGDRLDYLRLAASPAYREFRTNPAAALRTLDVVALSSREARLLAVLRRYLPDDERRRLLEARDWRVRLIYQPYDWRLNAAA